MIKIIKAEDLKLKKTPDVKDWKTELDKYRLDLTKPAKPPRVALSIGTYDYKGETYPLPFGTYGNFSCLVGQSKSMKTFLKSALIASYIGGTANNYFPQMRGHETNDKWVFDIDTEQFHDDAHRVAHRAMEMVGANYPLYQAHSLREESATYRFQYIEYLMMESEYRNNIGLIVIDGAADITDSVNDLETSNAVVQNLMKWTSIANCHLSTVLHQNFGSEKATGHLGSVIMKKAETVAQVKRDPETNIATVTPKQTRQREFREFRFTINDDALPFIQDDEDENGIF